LIGLLKKKHPRFFGEYNNALKLNAVLETTGADDQRCATQLQRQLEAGRFYDKGRLFVLDGINMPSEDTNSHVLAEKIQSYFPTIT